VSCYLIIPCFNEEDRLDGSAFTSYAKKNKDVRFIFANDGSKDDTAKVLETLSSLAPKTMYVYNAPHNKGKAAVIRDAFLTFDKEELFNSNDWIGYWDADLATPLWEVDNMYKYSRLYEDQIDSIWGSRLLRLGSDIRRSAKRHYLGRIFATVVGVVLNVKSYDSQCGAKLFNYESAKIAFSAPFISKWIFDVEILLRLQDKRIIEYPLRKWEDVPGSKVNISKDIFRVLKDLFQIWKLHNK
tara:strand:+ start:80788 stop:81513 length:726 start_codon:yes stop_codon:yes gene_type:complete